MQNLPECRENVLKCRKTSVLRCADYLSVIDRMMNLHVVNCLRLVKQLPEVGGRFVRTQERENMRGKSLLKLSKDLAEM